MATDTDDRTMQAGLIDESSADVDPGDRDPVDAPHGEGGSDAATGTGVRGIVEAFEPARPALPALSRALEAFERAGATVLGETFGGTATLAGGRPESLRFGDYVDRLPSPSETIALRADGWGGRAILTLGPTFTRLALDRMLGGGGIGRREETARSRPVTAIEAGILTKVANVLLRGASDALSALKPVVLVGEGLFRPTASDIARPEEQVLVLPFEIVLDERKAAFDLVFPASTLDPVRHLVSGRITSAGGRAENWAIALATELWQAEIEAEAILDEIRLPLGKVLDLAVGDTLHLAVKPSDLVDLRCGSLLLTRGRIGRFDGRIAVQIGEPVRPLPVPSQSGSSGAVR